MEMICGAVSGMTVNSSNHAQNLNQTLRSVLEMAALDMPPAIEVYGMKLAQLSRQGFDHWKSLYVAAAQAYASDNRELFILGHSTLVGLPEFVSEFKEKGKTFHVLIPTFIGDDLNPNCGYTISETGVRFLSKNFSRPEHAVVLDDTRRTGKTFADVDAFWRRESNSSPEFDVIINTG